MPPLRGGGLPSALRAVYLSRFARSEGGGVVQTRSGSAVCGSTLTTSKKRSMDLLVRACGWCLSLLRGWVAGLFEGSVVGLGG